jgi:phasin family protein
MPEGTPGPARLVETAGTTLAWDGAGEIESAEAPSAATPVPPATRATPALTDVMERPMQQANKATETMMKAAEEAAAFGRGNVEAITQATQIYVAGVQDLGKQTFAMVQGLADATVESAKALSSVKSLQEAMQIQSNYARAAMEKSVSESAKLGEAALKLTEQAFAPITARMTLAAEKITKVPAAA